MSAEILLINSHLAFDDSSAPKLNQGCFNGKGNENKLSSIGVKNDISNFLSWKELLINWSDACHPNRTNHYNFGFFERADFSFALRGEYFT